MTLEELYIEADNNNLYVIYYPNKVVKSFSTQDNWITIDVDKLTDSNEELTCLAHEMGHCMTDSFYSVNTPLVTVNKLEYIANKWAIKKIIPIDELNEVISSGITEIWDLADYFNTTTKFIIQATSYYQTKGKLCHTTGE